MSSGLVALLVAFVGAGGGMLGGWLGARATVLASRNVGWSAQAQGQRDSRRAAYADFAVAAGKADSLLAATWAFRGHAEFDHVPASLPGALAELDRARVVVALEGPSDMGELAQRLTRQASAVSLSIPKFADEEGFRREYEGIAAMSAQFVAAAREHLALPAERPAGWWPLGLLMAGQVVGRSRTSPLRAHQAQDGPGVSAPVSSGNG
jgi:hypothetical protein